jgi:hypothetical protein
MRVRLETAPIGGERTHLSGRPAKVDALLIHEFAHERVSNHLSEEFHSQCRRMCAVAGRDVRI